MFKRPFLCLPFLLTLCAASAWALTPRQIIVPFYSDEEYVTFEINDIGELKAGNATPLQQAASGNAASDDPLTRALQDRAENIAALFTFDGTVKKTVRNFLFAVELSSPMPDAEGESFSLPGQPPEGTELRPLGKREESDLGTVYLAQMRRGKQYFLLGAHESDLLAVMAAVPESTPTPRRRLEAHHFWGAIHAPSTPSPSGDGSAVQLPPPYAAEYSLWDTDRSLRMTLRWDTDTAPSSDKKKETTSPLLLGSGSLLGLFSLENTLSDEMRENIVDQCRSWLNSNGLDSDDLRDVLKGRITLGIAGTTSTLLGNFPGLYLHLAGANRRVRDVLLDAATKLLSEQAKTGTENFSEGIWKGFRTGRWSLLSAYGCVGDGVLLALQNSSELTRTPDLHDDMKAPLENPSPIMLNVDAEHLADALSTLLHRFGGLILNDEEQSKSETFLRAMKAFTVLNVTGGDGTLDAELFVRQPEYRRLFESGALDDRGAR